MAGGRRLIWRLTGLITITYLIHINVQNTAIDDVINEVTHRIFNTIWSIAHVFTAKTSKSKRSLRKLEMKHAQHRVVAIPSRYYFAHNCLVFYDA